jgi:16S rRNA processing protein RimM
MSENKRILIGEIATAHGIKGLVKLRSFVEDETLLEGENVYTSETGDKTISLKIKNPMKGDFLAEVKGVSDRNGAEALRATQLYIDRDSLPNTDDGEYYIEDMKGLSIITKNGDAIGTVLNVVNYGASDLIDIKPIQGGQNFYLPFIDDYIFEVDFVKGIVVVELPEGLV